MDDSMNKVDVSRWVEIQEKVFTRWCNVHLAERNIQLAEKTLCTGSLDNGLILWNLLEIISSKKLVGVNKRGLGRIHNCNNILVSLNFLKAEGVKLVGIGAEDIVDRKTKLVLGLIWTLILRYQIQKSASGTSETSGAARADLIAWLNSVGVNVRNLTSDFSDGKNLSQLVNTLKPGTLPAKSGQPVELVANAIETAFKAFDIPKVIDANDMATDAPDELSNMTYLSFFREKYNNAKAISVVESSIRPQTASPGKDFTFDVTGPIKNAGQLTTTGTAVDGRVTKGRTTPVSDSQASIINTLGAGKNSVDVFYSGVPIKGSPVPIDTAGGQNGASNSFAKVIGHSPRVDGIVGEPYNIQVFVQGVNEHDLVFKVTSPTGKPCATSLTTNKNGIIDIIIKFEEPGDHILSVTHNGKKVIGSDITINVFYVGFLTENLLLHRKRVDDLNLDLRKKSIPQFKSEPEVLHFFIEHEKKLFYEDSQITDLSLRLSKILGGNKHDTVIGEPFVVQVATVNMAVPDFAIKVVQPGGQNVNPHVTQNKNGVINIIATLSEEGTHICSVQHNKKPIRGSDVTIVAHREDFLTTDLQLKRKAAKKNIAAIQAEISNSEIPHFKSEPDLDLFFKKREDQLIAEGSSMHDLFLARLASVVGGQNYSDGIIGTDHVILVSYQNIAPTDLLIKIRQPDGSSVTDLHTVSKAPAKGLFHVTSKFRQPGVHVVDISLNRKPVRNSPVTVTVVSKAEANGIPEYTAVANLKLKISQDPADIPHFEREDDLHLFRKKPSADLEKGLAGISLELERRKPKAARVIGPQERGDAVENRPYTVQLGSMNVKPDDLQVAVIDAAGTPLKATVTPHPNGVVDITWTPTKPGPVVLDVKLDGAPVKSAPVTVHVLPGSAVTPQLNNQLNNVAKIQQDLRAKPLPVAASASDLDKIFSPKDHELEETFLQLEGQKLKAARVIGAPERADAVVNAPYTIQLGTMNVIPKDLQIVVCDPSGQHVDHKVTPNPNGVFDLTYTPRVPGQHLITITLRGKPIKNSPVKVHVLAADKVTPVLKKELDNVAKVQQQIRTNPNIPIATTETDFDKVFDVQDEETTLGLNRLEGQKLKAARVIGAQERADAVVGSPYTLQCGTMNVIPSDLAVVFKSPDGQALQVELVSHPNGVIDLIATPVKPGQHKFDIQLRGKPIKGSPVTVHALVASQVTPDMKREFDGIAQLQNDLKNAPLPSAGTEGDLEGIFAPQDSELTSKLNQLEGKKLKAVRVIGASERGDAVATRPYTIQLGSMNALPSDITIVVKGPQGDIIPHTLVPNPNGVFDLTITPPTPGQYVFDVKLKLNGRPAKGAPVKVHAVPLSQLTPELQKQLDGVAKLQDGIRNSPFPMAASEVDLDLIYAPKEAELSSKLKDVEGKKLKAVRVIGAPERGDAVATRPYCLQLGCMNVLPGDLTIVVKGPQGDTVKHALVAHPNGVIDLTITPPTPGQYIFEVTLNGRPAKGAPVKVHAVPASQLTPELQKQLDGVAKLQDGIRNSPFPIAASEIDLDLIYAPQEAELSNKLKDVEGKKLKAARVIGAPERGDAVVGRPYCLQLGSMNVSPADLAISVKDPNGAPLKYEVIAHPNGVIDVIATPSSPGHHVYDIKLNGRPIKGGPVRVSALPASQLTPELQQQLDGVAKLQNEIRGSPFPIAASEADLEIIYAPKEAELSSKLKDVEGKKLKAARVIGASERGDAVVGRPYCLQLGSMNVSPSDLVVSITDPNLFDVTYDLVGHPNGVIDVVCTPPTTGQHLFDIRLNGKPVKGSPVRVNVLHPDQLTPALQRQLDGVAKLQGKVRHSPLPMAASETDLDNVLAPAEGEFSICFSQLEDSKPKAARVIGQPLRSDAVAGAPYSLQVGAMNARPNDFEVSITGPQGQPVKPTIVQNPNGVFDINYAPDQPGAYTVDIKLNGKPVPGGPTLIHVMGPNQVTPAIQKVLNDVDKQKQDIRTAPFAVPASEADLDLIFAPKTAELDRALQTLEKAKPKAVHLIGPLERSDAVAGAPHTIQIAGMNAGKPDLDVVVKDPSGNPLKVQVVPNPNGVFDINYTPYVPGEYTIEVCFGGTPVKTPIHVHVLVPEHVTPEIKRGLDGVAKIQQGLRSDPFPPATSEAELIQNFQPADQELAHQLHGVEKVLPKAAQLVGNPERCDGVLNKPICLQVGSYNVQPRDLAAEAVAPSGKTKPVTIRPNPNGVFDVVYTPDEPGTWDIQITMQGKPVASDPIHVTVMKPAEVTPVVDQKLQGIDRLQKGLADSPLPLSVTPHELELQLLPHKTALDEKLAAIPNAKRPSDADKAVYATRDGNSMLVPVNIPASNKYSPTDLEVILLSPSNVAIPGQLVLTPEGIAIKFTPPEAGCYHAMIYFNDDPILDQPIVIIVPGVDAQPGPGSQFFVSGIPIDLSRYTLADLTCTITPPISGNPPIKGDLVMTGDEVGIKFRPTHTGRHLAQIYFQGTPLLATPTEIIVKPQGVAVQEIPDKLYNVTVDGIPAQLRPLQDTRGIILTYLPEDLQLVIKDSTGKKRPKFGTIGRMPDGIVDILFCPHKAGQYTGNATIFGIPILDNDVRMVVPPDVEHELSKKATPKAFGEGLAGLKDIDGKPLLSYDINKITVKLASPTRELIPAKIDPLTWMLSFQPKVVGVHRAQLYYEDRGLLPTPISVVVEPGTPVPQHIGFDSTPNVGEKGLQIQLEPLTDAAGLRIPCETSDISCLLTGPNNVTDRGNVAFLVEGIECRLVPSVPGAYTVQIYYRGKDPLLDQPLVIQSVVTGGINTSDALLLKELLRQVQTATLRLNDANPNVPSIADLSTFSAEFTTSAQLALPYLTQPWNPQRFNSGSDVLAYFQPILQGLAQCVELVASALGHIKDQGEKSRIISHASTLGVAMLEIFKVLNGVLVADRVGRVGFGPQLALQAKNAQQEIQNIVNITRRYNARLQTFNPTLRINLGGDPSDLVGTLVDWLNSRPTLQPLEAHLGHSLPGNLLDGLPYFTPILQTLLAQIKQEEVDFGILIDHVIYLLVFLRVYATDRVKSEVRNNFVDGLDDLSAVIIQLLGDKLHRQDCSNQMSQFQTGLRALVGFMKA